MRNLKRALSLTLASVMLLGMMVVGSSAASFPDVDDNDNIEAIDVLETVKVMVGNENGDFEPDKNVTRAEMAVVMAELLNLDYDYYVTSCPFNDVPDWAKGYVGACAANGIVSGRGEGVYDPSATVTAVEAASMMMRALGYFQNSGDYKPNFESATVRQASEISLFSGINGNAKTPLTRNQVAKLALNALEANMVTFTGDMGFEMPGVGNVGYRSEYTYRTGSEKKYAALSDLGDTVAVGGNRGQYYVQLGEELYDGKLTKRSGPENPDDFGRPATTWRYDGKDIGTYADEADATYTKSVKVGDIYKDLGLGSAVSVDNVTVYVDGVEDAEEPAYAIRKGDTDHSYGGNGVLTEVFYIKSNRVGTENSIVITEINTYTGEVSKTVAATDKKDAYVVIALESEKPDGLGGSLNYETDEKFDDDARVLYTYSLDSEEVKSLAVAENVSGEATRADNNTTDLDQNKGIVVDGNSYKFAVKADGDQLGQVSVGSDYDLYLDKYGYVIYLEEIEEIGDYALVLAAQDKGNFSSNRSLLVFADGTEKIVDTEKNYKSGVNKIEPGTIVTYRVDDGVYTLKPVSQTIGTAQIASATGMPNYADSETAALLQQFQLTNDKAGVKFHDADTDTDHYVYTEPRDGSAKTKATKITDNDALVVNANSSTVFVVYNGTDEDYAAYTGIKNVPSITAESSKKVVAYTYCKSGSMAKVMFIFVQDGSVIQDEGKNLVFLAGESVSDLIHDKTGDYFEYNAVVGDEITTVKVADDVAGAGSTLNGLYASYSVDKNGIITRLSSYTAFDNTTANKQALNFGTGVDKRSADYTVIMDTAGSKYTVTVDDAAKIYAVDEDGVITASSYRAIAKDENDKVYAVVQDWLVKHLFIETVPATPDAEYTLPGVAGVQWKVGSKDFGAVGASAAAKSGTVIQLKLADTSMVPTVKDADGNTVGTSNPSTGVYQFNMPGKNIASVTLKSANEYDGEIVFALSSTTVTAEWTGAVKPTDDELCNAMLDYLVSMGYPKSEMNTLTITPDTSISVKAKKVVSGVAGAEQTLTLTYSSGLTQVVEATTQAELNTALTGSATKIKLSADATLAAAPGKDIEVASGKTLTLTGDLTLTKDITGAGAVATTGDIAAAEKIKTTGGVSVATGKKLAANDDWAIAGDITGAGKVDASTHAITNGAKIKCTGGLTLSTGSVDTLSNVPLEVTGAVTALTTGRVAPSALTMTGTIAFDNASAELVIPTSATLMGITIGDTNGGKITLADAATVPASTTIALGAKGILDLNSKTLTGNVTSCTITTGAGAKIVGASVSTQNFFTNAGDGTHVANDEAAVQGKTFTWGATAGGAGVAGWAHA